MPELESQQEVVQPEGGEVEQPRSESEQGAEHSESEKPQKGKGGWQRSIDRLTRQRNEEREKYNAVLTMHQELLQRLGEKLPAQEAKQADDDPEPKIDNFQTYEEFTKALGRWAARQEHKTLTAKQREAESHNAAQSEAQKIFSEHAKRVEQARQELDDYDEVVEEVQDNGYDIDSEPVLQAIAEQENSARLMYHLAKNPELIDKLNGMSVTKAITEVGKIAAKLELPAENAEKSDESRSPEPVTEKQGKPEPIKPVRRSTAETVTSITGKSEAEDKISPEEWLRRRNAQIAKG